MVSQIPLEQLTTPAGIVVAGAIVRQLIEILKNSVLPWLDDGNERKGAVILSALLYLAWLAAYGHDLATDGWDAVFAFLAVSATAIGVNEGIDAGKGQVAKNVIQSISAQQGPAIATGGAVALSAGVAAAEAETVGGAHSGPSLDLLAAGGAVDVLGDGVPADPALGRS